MILLPIFIFAKMFLFLSSKMIDMELSDIRPLIEFYHSKLSQVSLDFKRYLYNKINWKARIIGIRGERGVGKTTMLIQRIKEKKGFWASLFTPKYSSRAEAIGDYGEKRVSSFLADLDCDDYRE